MQRVRHMNQHRTGTYRACTHLRPPPHHTHTHTHTHTHMHHVHVQKHGSSDFSFPASRVFLFLCSGIITDVSCSSFVFYLFAKVCPLVPGSSCQRLLALLPNLTTKIKWLGFDKGRKTLTRSSNVHIFHGNVGLVELRWEWSVIRWPEKLEVTFLPLSCLAPIMSSAPSVSREFCLDEWKNVVFTALQKDQKKSQHIYILVHGHMD